MELTLHSNSLTVKREKNDPRFYSSQSSWGDAESTFLYHVKKLWNSLNHQLYMVMNKVPLECTLVKKRMWKDGHLVDEMQQYLRSAKPVQKDNDGNDLYLCLSNDHWAVNGLDTDFNGGSAELRITLCNIDKTTEKRIRNLT